MKITVCIPTIPPRAELLERAVRSVFAQSLQPWGITVAYDHAKQGHGPTRTRAIRAADTEWVAFLDDDDELYPQHLQRLAEHQEDSGADVVFPWFDVIGGTDPFPEYEGKPWGEWHPFPIAVLCRRSVILDAGGFPGPSETCDGQDWHGWVAVFKSGARISHLPERTWAWHHDSGNTSGDPTRW